jgi:uncharacterized protein YbdZ (MbtH family)
MTHQKAINELLQGKRLAAKGWDTERYIYADKEKDGQIVDNDGKAFNMMTTKIKEWSLWTEPKAITETLDLMGAMTAVMGGKRLTAKGWDTERYIYADKEKDGQIVDNDGKAFNMMTTKIKEWSLWTEPKATTTALPADFKALMENMAKELTELKQTVNNDGMTNKNQDLLKLVYGVGSIKELEALFKARWESVDSKKDASKAVIEFVPFCWLGGREINTVASYYGNMRKVIKEVGGEYLELGLDLFVLKGEVYDRIAEKSMNTVKEKSEEATREEYDGEHIETVISELKGQCEIALNLNLDGLDDKKQIEAWKDAKLPIAKQQSVKRARAYLFTTYEVLVTGRRSVEVLKTLEIIKEGKEWFYKGIAKKGTDDAKIKAYSLDTDYEFLQALLVQIRSDLDTTKLTLKEVNGKYNRIFNRAFKKLTKTDYTFHEVREIWADMFYLQEGYNTGEWTEEFNFKAEILGHEIKKDRLKATHNYMTKKAKK